MVVDCLLCGIGCVLYVFCVCVLCGVCVCYVLTECCVCCYLSAVPHIGCCLFAV